MRYFLLLLFTFLLLSCSESPKFELLSSEETGIDFNNTIVETDSFHVMSYEYIYNGAGVGVGDLNNDGLQDLIFAGNQVSSKVYLNKGKFRFEDITSSFAGLTNNQWYSSVTIVDINNDRWLDVYLTSTADNNPRLCKNRLWINSGIKDGKGPFFAEMAEEYGIASENQSVNAAFLDYDRDGDLDLYVLNNTVTQRMNTSYRVKITDGSANNNDKLYRNEGNGKFTDVTIQAGIVFEGFGLGLAIGDVNKDGYPDIYVSNDYISNDLLYINQRNGTFRNEIRKYLSYQTKSSMGNDMADVDNDGNPDIFTLDMMPEHYYKKKQTINGFSYIFYINDAKYDYEHQYLRNMLHLHNGFIKGEMLPYSEVGQMLGLHQTEWSWSPLFADYDNDGDKDLLIANGFPKDMTDKDWTRMKAKVYGFVADEKYVIDMLPALKVQNFAFENAGKLSFINRSKEWLPDIPSYSYGASFVDLDNDGDLDYVTNNLNDNAFILRNNTIKNTGSNAGYLRIKLNGKDGNTMALGAKIELWSNGKYQFTENFLTRGYASSVDPIIHFGLAGDHLVDSVKVVWPATGNISIVKNITANQTLTIDENESKPAIQDTFVPAKTDLLFSKKENIVDYTHIQEDFNDFFLNQNILPHKFSQIGPIMAKGDIDMDGTEDIIIGSTNTLPTTVFLRRGSAFKQTQIDSLTTFKNYSESDLSIVDIDGDGDNDIIAVAGGYDNPEENEYCHFVYINSDGKFNRKRLPVPSFPASVIRVSDYDHDGDPDIFVGARIKKGMFPYSNQSWLIRNNNGVLSSDASSKLNLGLVTDALWSDYDGDGWEDLLVTREWNSIAVLKNIGGKELVSQKLKGMDERLGFWYTIAAGDLDSDGDTDYIAGNLGDNHRFTVSEKYPMGLYSIDLDLDGNIDPLTTAYWKNKEGLMTDYPINYLDELLAQSVFFQKKFADYTSFSYMGINDILDADVLSRLDFKLNVNTTSSYILWNNEGGFNWEKLPVSAQISAVKKILVRDLNGDKFPDLLLAGNDYTYDVSTGFYDAGKGIVLINKGINKPFVVMPYSASGILLKGMVESLLCIEGDTTLVVAGINRDRISVFQINK